MRIIIQNFCAILFINLQSRWPSIPPWTSNPTFSKFQRFEVSKCFDICCSNIIKNSLHVFWQILIPYSSFSSIVWTDRQDRSVPVSSKRLCSISEISRLPKIINGNESGLFMICLKYPSVSKDKYYWFWGLEPRPQIGKLLIQNEAESMFVNQN